MKKNIIQSYLIYSIVIFIGHSNIQALKIDSKKINLQEENVSQRPTIGIVTLEMNDQNRHNLGDYDGYVPSSYIKWIEQTAANTIVIPHFLPKGQIKDLIDQIDGVLFPGGAPDLIL